MQKTNLDKLNYADLEDVLGMGSLSPTTKGDSYSLRKGTLVVPGSYGSPTLTKTLAKVENWKIGVWSIWGGNGMGTTSYYYLYNIVTGAVYHLNTGGFGVRYRIDRLRSLLTLQVE